MQDKTDTLARRAPFIAILVVAVLGVVFLRDRLGFDILAEHHEALLAYRDAHMAQAVVLFMAAYVLIVAFSLPGATVATLTGGFLFGLFPGALINAAAATVGAVLIFSAARSGFGAQLAARIDTGEGAVRRLKRGIDDNQWSVLFLMRLVPAVPFFVANVVPAFLNVPLHRFFVTTALGILPGALVFTSIGAGLGDVLARGERPDLGLVFEPHILLPLIGLIALAALPIALKLVGREAKA